MTDQYDETALAIMAKHFDAMYPDVTADIATALRESAVAMQKRCTGVAKARITETGKYVHYEPSSDMARSIVTDIMELEL